MEAASEIVGVQNTSIDGPPSTGSEDFADFLKVIPGAYCNIGHGGNVALHSPNFFLDPDCLTVGASVLSRIIEKRLLYKSQ